MDIQPVVVDRGLLRTRSDSGETWEDGGGVGLGGGVVGDLDGGVGDFDQKQMVKGAGEGLDLANGALFQVEKTNDDLLSWLQGSDEFFKKAGEKLSLGI